MGQNPYIAEANFTPATKKFKVTYLYEGKESVVEVDPTQVPYGDHGLPGSILDIAMGHRVPLDHACGGVCACSTCHVIVREGGATCNEPEDAELDELDLAAGVTTKSRLGCQTVPNGNADIVVEIPAWNRNAAKEEH